MHSAVCRCLQVPRYISCIGIDMSDACMLLLWSCQHIEMTLAVLASTHGHAACSQYWARHSLVSDCTPGMTWQRALPKHHMSCTCPICCGLLDQPSHRTFLFQGISYEGCKAVAAMFGTSAFPATLSGRGFCNSCCDLAVSMPPDPMRAFSIHTHSSTLDPSLFTGVVQADG